MAAAQQYRSQRRAQARGRRLGHEGEVGGDEAKVAMTEIYDTGERRLCIKEFDGIGPIIGKELGIRQVSGLNR